jgi:hypothetical protein
MIAETTSDEKHVFHHNYHLTPSVSCLRKLVLFSMVNSYNLLNKWSRRKVVVHIALSRVCSFAEILVTNTVTTSTLQSVTASAKPTVCKLCLESIVAARDYIDRLYGSRSCDAPVSSYRLPTLQVISLSDFLWARTKFPTLASGFGEAIRMNSETDSSSDITYCAQGNMKLLRLYMKLIFTIHRYQLKETYRMRNSWRILVGKSKGRRSLGRHRSRWEDNIKTAIKVLGYGLDSSDSG